MEPSANDVVAARRRLTRGFGTVGALSSEPNTVEMGAGAISCTVMICVRGRLSLESTKIHHLYSVEVHLQTALDSSVRSTLYVRTERGARLRHRASDRPGTWHRRAVALLIEQAAQEHIEALPRHDFCELSPTHHHEPNPTGCCPGRFQEARTRIAEADWAERVSPPRASCSGVEWSATLKSGSIRPPSRLAESSR